MVTYDPTVLQKHAEELYTRARSLIVWGALLGGALFTVAVTIGIGGRLGLGGGVGAFVLGAAIGALWGHGRGAALRLQAQLALCQKQIEENTRGPQSSTVGQRKAFDLSG